MTDSVNTPENAKRLNETQSSVVRTVDGAGTIPHWYVPGTIGRVTDKLITTVTACVRLHTGS